MSPVQRSHANHSSSHSLGSDGQSASGRSFAGGWLRAWDSFWFAPSRPETLALIRICTGLMLAYVHIIWLSAVSDFFGPTSWINPATLRSLHAEDWSWSWLNHVQSLPPLYLHQVIAIAASLAMALGWFTRVAIPLVWWLTLMVCHRQTGALFGLDQIVMMLSMYLMWSNCGSVWSLDGLAVARGESKWLRPTDQPAVVNTIATRLIQLHLCVIYLFGGLSKMRGEMWWDGSAFWFSVVNYEYQSLDLTWLGNFPILVGLITAVTIFWETSYCALVWPSLTRPITLALVVLVHGGIGLALGMWTFGTIMIVANLVFVRPEALRRFLAHLLPKYISATNPL